MSLSVFAVTPLVLAPVVVLAMLFPAVFAGPLAFLRRWWLFLNVCTLSLTVYTVCVVFTGVRKRFWWAHDVPMWMTLALVTLTGAAWAWYRHARRPTRQPAGASAWPVQGLLLGMMAAIFAVLSIVAAF